MKFPKAFAMADFVWEMTAAMVFKFCRYELFEHLLFLFVSFCCLLMIISLLCLFFRGGCCLCMLVMVMMMR